MNSRLQAVISALFDGPLWKAIAMAIAAPLAIWGLQELFDDSLDALVKWWGRSRFYYPHALAEVSPKSRTGTL